MTVVRECPTPAGWRAKRLRRQVRRQNLLIKLCFPYQLRPLRTGISPPGKRAVVTEIGAHIESGQSGASDLSEMIVRRRPPPRQETTMSRR